MRAHIRLFAFYREQAGADRFDLTLPEGSTVASAIKQLLKQRPALSPNFMPHLIAVNDDFASPDYPLTDGDEIAFYPPVSGGSHSLITENPINCDSLTESTIRSSNGAIVTFKGVTRNENEGRAVRYLEYEAHHSMATKVMREILDEVTREFNITDLAVQHRVGHLNIGDVSLFVAAGSPHRREAFGAVQHIVNRIKEIVPIWKKEHFTDGSIWVGSANHRD